MKFVRTPLNGAYTVELEKREDDRGFFARMFCTSEFAKQGITFIPLQMNNSASIKKGTVRGLHFQAGEKAEAKFFRCIAGRAYTVIVDLRPDSPSFRKWYGVELNPVNRTQLFMPKGCAAGYMALEDNTEMIYVVDAEYAPEAERGLRWNDPAFAIEWPVTEGVIVSEKDGNAPYFK